MLPSSQFVERECRESKKSPDGKRKFGSPSGSGKKKKTYFPGKIRGAVDVLIRIKSLDTGVVPEASRGLARAHQVQSFRR